MSFSFIELFSGGEMSYHSCLRFTIQSMALTPSNFQSVIGKMDMRTRVNGEETSAMGAELKLMQMVASVLTDYGRMTSLVENFQILGFLTPKL